MYPEIEDFNSSYTYAGLILKQLRGEMAAEEKKMLDAWLATDPRHQQLLLRLSDEKYIGDELEVYATFDKAEARERLLNQIDRLEEVHSVEGKHYSKNTFFCLQRSLWIKGLTAAAAVAAITLGVWIYTSSINGRHPDAGQDPGLAYTNDIAPGKNTAILTLASGLVIPLDTNKTSVIITDSVKTTTTLTASTPRGGTYQVTLPDGTQVWLNADSKISFPSQFIGKERKILLLNGEAYFEVSKDKNHPFIVESEGQRVEVLGTHFNINSYADEGTTKTTLLEGSVRIAYTPRHPEPNPEFSSGSGPRNRKASILKPNQQAILEGDDLQVKAIDAAEAIAWKQGEFVFKNEDFKTAMRRIARWYDVEVVYQNEKPIKLDPRGWVSRNSNISSVLKMIESTGDVHFKIEGRRVIVTN